MPSVEQSLNRIRDFTRQQRFEDAVSAAHALCASTADCREAWYLLAVNQRCLKQIAAALATLDRLEQEYPQLGRLYQERGYCYLSLRDAARASNAFEQAVSINPALESSWRALESLYRLRGDIPGAERIAQQLAILQRMPADLVRAAGLVSEDELDAAEPLLHACLQREAEDIEVLRLLSIIAQRRGRMHDAEQWLAKVRTLAPDSIDARSDHALLLLERQKYQQAIEHLDWLIQHEPHNGGHRMLRANAHAGRGDHEAALHDYECLLDAASEHEAALQVLRGHSLQAVGKKHEAIASYRAAAAARPGFGDAYWSLANLKTDLFDDQEITAMQAALASADLPTTDAIHLHFALGKAWENRAAYSQSWAHYSRGNALKSAQTPYRAGFLEANTQMTRQLFTPAFLAARTSVGCADSSAIFIVGLPRSGSTLIEQILASHSQVEGTQELPLLPRMVEEIQGYPQSLATWDAERMRELGQRYLEESREFRHTDRGYFIDKMPNNFRHIGLIHLMLPNAKIIDVRREPMACCVGNFKQLYASGQEFSYDLKSMAHYYTTYLELMRHWDRVLPGQVLRIYHEDVVADIEYSVRRLLSFCGLGFEQACLQFHQTQRTVSTASSEQVRRPIDRDALGQWRHFEPWLSPLKELLDDALTRYRPPH
jgi:tetratricopeptide (TPR) repeat protein